jgi:lipoate-protein ligase A
MPHTTWRLLIDDPADGAANMARDEAIATVHAAGTTPPTLRLYRWRPACLSLGRFQRGDAVDRAACARAGVQVVRRPSGGRALLHADELTYAVIARADQPPLDGGAILESYRRISAALLAGLRRLGADAELAPVRRADHRPLIEDRRSSILDPLSSDALSSVVSRRSSAACFDAPASHELTVGGRKLVGSAQTRRDGILLQHGAIPLTPHAEQLAALLAAPPADLGDRMIALGEALGRPVGFSELADALVAGFVAAWGIRFERGALTAEECAIEERLRGEKYADAGWTYAR